MAEQTRWTSRNQRIDAVMKHQVVTIELSANLVSAAERMRLHNVGCLPVMEGDKLAGMITDRDIILRNVAQNLNPARTSVLQTMTVNPMTCHAHESVHLVKQHMIDHQVKRLPVLNRGERLVGIVSFGDIDGHRPQLRPSNVTFYKMISDPIGRQHKVTVATVYVPPADDEEAVALTAMKQLEERHGVKSWTQLAQAYDIEMRQDGD